MTPSRGWADAGPGRPGTPCAPWTPTPPPAPRMHFLDDAGGATGKIWIGYLGDHLPNTRTN